MLGEPISFLSYTSAFRRRGGAHHLRVWYRVLVASVVLVACAPQASPRPATPNPTAAIVTERPVRSDQPTARASPSATAALESGCGEIAASSPPTAARTGRFAVYSADGSIFLYDAAADTATTVDSPGLPAAGFMPRFRTADQVWFAARRSPADDEHFFGQDSLYEIVGGEPVESLRLPNIVMAYDWSPDGETLAFLLRADTASGNQPVQLCQYDPRTATLALIRSLGYPDGTGTGQREESSVTWSPDGRVILVVDTAERPSLWVTNVDGQDVVEPREATFGRWLDADTIFFQEDVADDVGDWRTLSIRTGSSGAFNLPRHAHRPAVSPDGNLIAFDDGGTTPSVYVFDVASGTTRRLGNRQAGPLWLDSEVLAVTAVGPCTTGLDCTFPWKSLNETVGIEYETANQRALALPSTLQLAYRREVIDAWIGDP